MEVKELPVRLIQPNPLQTRKNFDKQKLRELGESIKSHGLINPITVQTTSNGYQLITGERRLRAAKLVGIDGLPAIIKQMDNKQASKETLIENVHRENLTPIEKGEAILKVFQTQENIQIDINFHKKFNTLNSVLRKDKKKLTHEQKELLKTCNEIQIYPLKVYFLLRPLFELEKNEIEKIREIKDLNTTHTIGGIKNKEAREKVINRIKDEKLGVKESVNLISSVRELSKNESDIKQINIEKEPIDHIQQQAKDIKYVRSIPQEELDKEVKRFEKVGEALKEAKKIEIEMEKTTKELNPESRASREAFQNLEILTTMDGLIKKANCPVCDGGPENLIWECCGLKAVNAADEAEEKFKRLLKEARRIKKENK